MLSIPEEPLEQIERGNVLLFIGERVARLAKASVATPTRRTMVFITALLVIAIISAYVFSASCYYVEIGPSAIPGEQSLFVHRGHPLLPLPGLGGRVV